MDHGKPNRMTWPEIAASAYRAYLASAGSKYFTSGIVPEFNDLPLEVRIAWEAAARQVGDCLGELLPGDSPDESRWAGWVPPQ